MKKFWKNFFKLGLLCSFLIIAVFLFYFGISFILSPVKFDKSKITNSNLSINIFDNKQRPLEHTFINGDYVTLNQIPLNTQQCFISIEDKMFYKHKGINYKRIVSATAKNLTSFSFKEGASTISQQLIKNTHLSSKKSIKRKINEIKLTIELEKNFSKDEILEYYLNAIYFGDNCYGIQNASEHYFSKPVSKLTLDESALLAGIIKSPNKYHPINNYKNSIKRRNIVLKEMLKDKKITENDYNESRSKQTKIIINSNNNVMNSYAKATIKEAQEILHLPEKYLALGGYRIFTYMDKTKQDALENCIYNNEDYNCSMISQNVNTGVIEAYAEKSTLQLITIKRQPASAIKPILVYAPAINENIISPSTVILDENISINGYKPQNIGGKEHGYVSAREALSNSYNIPAVKVLSYIGVDKAKRYLERQNVVFDDKDDNFALALGGMTYGLTLKELTNCYQTLANKGNYIKSSFINYILDNKGKVIYKNNYVIKNIYREDSSYLVTDMLRTCAKKGTAKRMNDLNFEVASKTGTSSISKKNIDAYNISYTSQDVVGCWIGNIDNTPINIVGGGKPTEFVKNYMKYIYRETKPDRFTIPSSIVALDIDTIARDNEHIIYIANNLLPERYKEKAYFSRFNIPKTNISHNLTMKPMVINGKIINGVAIVAFNAEIYYKYVLYRSINGKEEIIDEITEKNGRTTFNISQPPNVLCKYYIKSYLINHKNQRVINMGESNQIELYYKT